VGGGGWRLGSNDQLSFAEDDEDGVADDKTAARRNVELVMGGALEKDRVEADGQAPHQQDAVFPVQRGVDA